MLAYVVALVAAFGAMSALAQDDPFGPRFARTYPEIAAVFADIAQANPTLVTKHSLLTTQGGRELALYSLGSASAKKRVLLICNHHGDEQWVAQLCVDFVKYLVWAKDRDPLVHDVLARGVIDVVPLGNPDGFAAQSRYNARGNDINRNFPYQWSHVEQGTSNARPGPAPASEAETKALMAYQLAHKDEWAVILNYHLRYEGSDGANYILTPWAYTRHATLTAAEENLYRPFYPTQDEAPTFTVDTVPNVFYPCPGTHTDWSWATFGAPALTMELGHGYELPTRTTYVETFLKTENLPVLRRFLTGYLAALSPPPR